MAGGYVQKAQFVRTRRIVDGGLGHRVAGVLEIDEVDPFDDPTVRHVEARDDAGPNRHDSLSHLVALAKANPGALCTAAVDLPACERNRPK